MSAASDRIEMLTGSLGASDNASSVSGDDEMSDGRRTARGRPARGPAGAAAGGATFTLGVATGGGPIAGTGIGEEAVRWLAFPVIWAIVCGDEICGVTAAG
jgi:hypothetical protein